MESEQIDLNNVCRTCKNESPEMKSLYHRDSESGKENPRLDEMLMACTTVQVNNEDNLPKIICRTCFVQLKNAYCFKEQCEKTDVFLKDYLKNLKGDDIKQEVSLNKGEYVSNAIADNESTPNDTKDDKDITENIKDDPEFQSGESGYKDVDYVQVFEDLTIFECRTCSKIFYTVEGLRNHKKVHTGKAFKCKQCDKSYIRLNHLQRHELSHSKRKVHVCKICKKTLTRFQHLKRHLVTHLKEKPYNCAKCNRGFARVEHYQSHVKSCKGEKHFVCDVCNKSFLRQDSLTLHMRIHEDKEPLLPTLESLDNIEQHYVQLDIDDKMDGFSLQSDDDDENEDKVESEESDMGGDTMEPEVEVSENNDQDKIDEIAQITNEIYAEENSSEMLVEKAIIEDEMYKENNEIEEETNIDADYGNEYESEGSAGSEYIPRRAPPTKIKRGRGRPRKYPIGYKPSTGRPRGRPPLHYKIVAEPENDVTGTYPCPQCDEVFTKVSLLERHADRHEGLRIHECETCNKKFRRMNGLKRHKLSHVDVKPYLCVICTKCFARRDHLAKHMKLHSSTDTYNCDACEMVFHKEESLARHKAYKHNIGEKVPVSEKKFKCQYCQKGFTTEKYRDSHMQAHFGDKKFQCKTCEKTFISKSHLTEHMKFHNDSSKKFLCSECGQRFIRNDYLVIHMRRHRGEKPFKCKFCGKGFPRTTDLTVHERYHTGEKTHLCVICGRGFGRAYNLTVHMRTHTGEKPYRCTYCDAAFAQGNDLKAHVRRHTGERFQCELCPETFLMGYLLTQHKRVVHGLNIVSNIRRLQPVSKLNPDDPPPITVPLPTPVVVASAIPSDPLQIEESDMPELKQE